jgi:hypothetical protein
LPTPLAVAEESGPQNSSAEWRTPARTLRASRFARLFDPGARLAAPSPKEVSMMRCPTFALFVLWSTTALAGQVKNKAGTLTPVRASLKVVLHDGKRVDSTISYTAIESILKQVDVAPGKSLLLASKSTPDVVGFDPRAYKSMAHPYRNAALNLVLKDANGKTENVHVLFKSAVNRGGSSIAEMLDGTLASNTTLSDLRPGHVKNPAKVK